MPQFCMLFYAKYTILVTQKGGHGPMPPPLNTPLLKTKTLKNARIDNQFWSQRTRDHLVPFRSALGSRFTPIDIITSYQAQLYYPRENSLQQFLSNQFLIEEIILLSQWQRLSNSTKTTKALSRL